MIKISTSKEKLVGGSGDYKPDSDFLDAELSKGISDETEHTTDKQIAKEIAKDHLMKNPEYYSELEKTNIEKPSKKLSKYWLERARRRAKNANRAWPNSLDRKWARSQQEKSKDINYKLSNIYKDELKMTDELNGSIEEFLHKVKEQKKIFNSPKKFGPGTPKKNKKSFKALKPSKKTGILSAVEKKAKQYKKEGGKNAAVIAGSGGFGPGGGSLEENNMSLKRELRRMVIEQIGRKQMQQERLNESSCGDAPKSYFGGAAGLTSTKSMPKEMMMGDKKQGIDIDPHGYEGRMAKNNLFKMAEYAARLHNMIQDNENLEPWVEEKIAVAASMIDTVAHYLEYEKMRG